MPVLDVPGLLAGKATKRVVVTRLLPAMLGILFGCFLIASLLFPPDPVTGGPGYVPFTRTISGQGNRDDNPGGAWAFTLGLVVTAVMLVPYHAFAWRRFATACKGTATFTFVLLIIASIGFAMVGIWDERSTCILEGAGGACVLQSKLVHNVGSALAFGGNLLAVLLHLFPAVKARRVTGGDPFGARAQLVHVVAFVATIACAAILPAIPATGSPVDIVLRSSFWQWTMFLELVVYYVSLAIRLPVDVDGAAGTPPPA